MAGIFTNRVKWVAAGVVAVTVGVGSASAQIKVGGVSIGKSSLPTPSFPKIPTPSLPSLPNIGPSPGWKDADPFNKNGTLGSVFNPTRPPAPPVLGNPTGPTLGQSVPGKPTGPVNSNNTTNHLKIISNVTNNTQNNTVINQAPKTNGLDVAVAGISAFTTLAANRQQMQMQQVQQQNVQPYPAPSGQPYGQPRPRIFGRP